jgi:hypothetical protein
MLSFLQIWPQSISQIYPNIVNIAYHEPTLQLQLDLKLKKISQQMANPLKVQQQNQRLSNI